MEMLNIHDRVNITTKRLNNVPRIGVVVFVTDCGKYAKVRYSIGKKEFTEAMSTKNLEKI